MANYRKRYSKMTGKWTPVAAVSKTLSTRKIAERIEKESTVSIADIMAALYSRPRSFQEYHKMLMLVAMSSVKAAKRDSPSI